jgi:hypothetical protein
MEITFRNITYPPQTVFADGIKVGRVDYTDNPVEGWNAYDLDGNWRGLYVHKSEAGRALADVAQARLDAQP